MLWSTMIQKLLDSGLSQHEIAEACNCSQTVISLLYTGKRSNPKYKTGNAIEKLYNEIIRNS